MNLATRARQRLITYRSSIQTRLALITALSVALAVVAISAGGLLAARSSMYNRLDQELLEVAVYTSEPVSADIDGLGGLNATALQAANATLILVRTDGTVRRVSGLRPSLTASAEEITVARTQEGNSTRTAMGTDGELYRIAAVPLATENGLYALVIGRPLTPTLATLTTMGNVNLLLGFAFVAIAIAIGYVTGDRLMRPLNRLASVVATVRDSDSLDPIGVYTNDEIGDLSRSFDAMLESLQHSRERQHRLIADAGHELRTPLTSMRTNVELLVADESNHMLPAEARADILSDVAAQLGEFTSLVGDLVQLTRDEQVTRAHEPLDLVDVVNRAVERAQRRGPGITFIVTTEPTPMLGDAGMLERTVTNLLDNAVKFSPEDGTIWVTLAGHRLEVTDQGPGIADEDMAKIFDRFYRSDKARNTPGTGLGLSIVDHTVKSHNGTVWVENVEPHGARFIIEFPEPDD